MTDLSRRDHWENVYREKGEHQVSWFQDTPSLSLDLLGAIGATRASAIIDIGGGASRLVDALIARDFDEVTVLDLSDAALSIAKARLGQRAGRVAWIAADVTQWRPQRQYDIWHDRAAFHFLISQADRSAYLARLHAALRPGGHAIIGTFALDGPERCSGLPVVRYDAASLSDLLGGRFEFLETRAQDHATPWGSTQRFQFGVFRRR